MGWRWADALYRHGSRRQSLRRLLTSSYKYCGLTRFQHRNCDPFVRGRPVFKWRSRWAETRLCSIWFKWSNAGCRSHACSLFTFVAWTECRLAVQEDNAYLRNRRLVCFDMDSTLIEQEADWWVGDWRCRHKSRNHRTQCRVSWFPAKLPCTCRTVQGMDASVLP